MGTIAISRHYIYILIQEGQECPKTGVLKDFGYLDGGFDIVTPHVIPFWNPWDHGSKLELFTRFLSPSELTGRSRMYKNLGFKGFWVS